MNETLIKEIEKRYMKHNQVKIDKLTYEKTLNEIKNYKTLQVTDYNKDFMTTIDEDGQYRRFIYGKVISVDFTPDEHI